MREKARITSRAARTPRLPSSQPPLGTESRWLPRMRVWGESPGRVIQRLPAASVWSSMGRPASLVVNQARAASQVSVQATR